MLFRSELRFLQTQLKAYLELRFCKRSLKKRSYTAPFFVVDTTSVCTPSIECPNSGSIASPSVLPLASSPVPRSDYPLRKSSRSHKPLSYLQDYSCNSISKPIASGPYDIAHHISNAHLSTSHRSFVLASSSTTELESFHQAVQPSDWRAAMDKEITALESNSHLGCCYFTLWQGTYWLQMDL